MPSIFELDFVWILYPFWGPKWIENATKLIGNLTFSWMGVVNDFPDRRGRIPAQNQEFRKSENRPKLRPPCGPEMSGNLSTIQPQNYNPGVQKNHLGVVNDAPDRRNVIDPQTR